MRRLSLHNQIFLAMAIGLAAGFAMNLSLSPDSFFIGGVIWWMDLIGRDIFVGALKMVIAPLILASIITGVSTLPRAEEFGRIGGRIGLFYLGTTSIAVCIGILVTLAVQPGKRDASRELRAEREVVLNSHRTSFMQNSGLDPASPEGARAYQTYLAQQDGAAAASKASDQYARMADARTLGPGALFKNQLLAPLLSNPFKALAEANTLGIIFFAILLGLGCLVLGEKAQPVVTFFSVMNDLIMLITLWIMKLSPIAIGCLMASMIATLGLDALRSLAWYSATVLLAIGIHTCVLLVLVAVLGKVRPLTFIRGFREAWMVGFSTASSAATLPVSIHCVTRKLGVSNKVAEFTLPVGATMNMDGTALYEAVAIMFLLQMYGGLDDVPTVLAASNILIVAILAVIVSVGVAAIPSAGIVAMALVAESVGLPVHYIVIILAVDRFLDMFRTATNITGDAVGAVVVGHWESKRLASSS